MTKKTFNLAIFSCTLFICFYTNLVIAQSWSHYKGHIGDIEFDYPNGWSVGVAGNAKYRYNENMYMQPPGQEFNARYGQVVVRIFDPVSVSEDAKSLTFAFSLSLFNNFVATISDGQSFATRTVIIDGRSYYTCDETGSGYTTRIVGAKSPNGNMYVVAMASAPGMDSNNNTMLYHIAASLSGAEPKKSLSPAEAVMKRWYDDLHSGNVADLTVISSKSAQQMNFLTLLAQQMFGAPNSQSAMILAMQKFDFSHLRFYAVAGNPTRSIVRVCGNIINNYGEVVPFHQYASQSGNGNLFIIDLEDGNWKIFRNHHL